MAEGGVQRYLTQKLVELAEHVITVVTDLILLGVWLVGEYSFERFLIPNFPAQTWISAASLWVFRVIFAASTLIPCASKIQKHIRIFLLRDKIEVQQAKEVLRAKAVAAGEETTQL